MAIHLFEDGHVDNAARKLGAVRKEAMARGDEGRCRELERVATGMRTQLNPDILDRFNDLFYAVERDESDKDEIDVSPIGLAVAVGGALALIIACFLPYAEPTSFARVAQNTLIENGDGWILIVLAVGELFTLYRMYMSRRRNLGPIITGIIATGIAVYEGTNKSNLRLCPIGSDPLGIGCETAKPGIGIYVAGVGGLLMIVGGWQLYRASPRRVAIGAEPIEEELGDSKTCPDCAETVKLAARVCRYCGHQFEGPPDAAPV
jgi:hypothetical protein